MTVARRDSESGIVEASKSADAAATCPCCGAARLGSYCAGCGQRFLDRRFTLWTFAGDALRRLVNLEHGITHTFLRLLADPGIVVRDYLRGRTVIYVHPFAYLVLAFAAFALTFRLLGGAGGEGNQVFFGAVVFLLAAASRVIFWRSGLNLAEHLILTLFLYAQVLLLLTVGMVAVWPLPQSARPTAGVFFVGVACAYVMWGYSRIFPKRRWLAALGGLLVLVTATALWAATMMIIVASLARN